MTLYAAVTASSQAMPYTVFHTPLEQCEADLKQFMESAESTGEYRKLSGECQPQELPEKPPIPTVNPEDPVG